GARSGHGSRAVRRGGSGRRVARRPRSGAAPPDSAAIPRGPDMSDDRSGLPLLWHFPISHFNEKARWALDWKRLPHRREVLALGYMSRAWWASGQVRLPILFLDGVAVSDSTRIIEALEKRQPEPPLYPSDPAERTRALALE